MQREATVGTPTRDDETFIADTSFVIMEPERVHTVPSSTIRLSMGQGNPVAYNSEHSSWANVTSHRTSSKRPSITRCSIDVKPPLSNGFKRSRARGESLLLDARFLSDEDASRLILQANRPPCEDGSTLEEMMQSVKARQYYQQQFAKIQEQAGMNPRTLRFSPVYEDAYATYCQKSSLLRVRFCFLLGMCSLGFFLWYDTTQPSYKATATMPFWTFSFATVSRKDILDVLSIVGPVAFGAGVLLTYFKRFQRGVALEMMSFVVFGVVALSLIVRKPVGRYRGPVLPLVILLIPVFGITKMRFQWSCVLGWATFALYLTIQLASKKFLDDQTSEKWDSVSDLVYQSINYGISIIGGMVSHYRQELLRRRNFALQLPFAGLMVDDSVELKDDKFKKRALLRRVTMAFRHPDVEAMFYKHWYLIDPFPFKNPNEAGLHAGEFRVLRFPIYGLLVDQVILGIQDYKLLWLPGHPVKSTSPFTVSESAWAYYASLVCRYAVIVPCYLSIVGLLYCMGRAFYTKWLAQTNQDDLTHAALLQVEQGTPSDVQQVSTLALNVARWRQWRDERWTDMLTAKGGYARFGQMYASMVVALHVGCIAMLLLWVTRTTHKKQNVYFMGLLNALLFPHRSGFRIRFIYATVTTVTLAMLFMFTSALVLDSAASSSVLGVVLTGDKDLRNLWIEYVTYIVVVVLLGMFVSREEESLRRSFFILKSLRTLEFEEWFHTLLKIQGWMRIKLKAKLHHIRIQRTEDMARPTDDKRHANVGTLHLRCVAYCYGFDGFVCVEVVADTSPYMGMASKYGIYAQSFNLAAVLVDLILSLGNA
ncbi:hypothetical protein DYB30_011751 [Aphanomyces astaci]|uniref:Uncharacterized protein n=1 Tax=Aphanomyces astaci TaxID=112090 RepID=A0A397D4F7_APHAT|nr:hypothetical protein DYB30_011751 [Aphanomyces astaci]